MLATLPTGRGPHEVAISHDGRWAVVSNYGPRGEPGSSITVIDVPGHRVARAIEITGYQRPNGMAFLPGDTLLETREPWLFTAAKVDLAAGPAARPG